MGRLYSICLAILCISGILLISCTSDRNSSEACRFQTTKDLDRGNFDAVVASACAEPMQKGAAYLGKAGFDINDIVNRFSETGSDSGSASGDSDLNIFLNKLVPEMNSSKLNLLSQSKNEYALIADNTALDGTDQDKDASFYIGIVDAVTGMSVIKMLVQKDGFFDLSCDANGNQKSDDVEAATCALKLTADPNFDCSTIIPGVAVTVTPPPLTIELPDQTGNYLFAFKGLHINTGGSAGADCGDYYKVLFEDPSAAGTYIVATTTEERCGGSTPSSAGDGKWPCPINDPKYMDFVKAVDSSLTTAIQYMGSSLVSDVTGTTRDVQQSINEMKTDKCCSESLYGENANDPSSCTCSSRELADYLMTF